MTDEVVGRNAREPHDESSLVALIEESKDSESVVRTTLKTDERVIARVTDGIYRQPASAIRELISNAYDADASRVVIKTDAPRFDRITVEDDGRGMSPVTLANLLFHIGGSAKRNEVGQDLGIASKDDPFRSPGGRVLIGKIGIGLFSVSQLTHAFQLITKVEGDEFRTIATVVLRQYSDDQMPGPDRKYESGKVNIWRERATDAASHGTTIVLTSVRRQARDTLRSREIWSALEQAEATALTPERISIEPPRFHVGRVDASGELLAPHSGNYSSVPWTSTDSAQDAFEKLVNAVWQEADRVNPNPQLERIFDYYLRMVWQLSLAIPLPYVDLHPFDMTPSEWLLPYLLSNDPKGAATDVPDADNPLRASVGLRDPVESAAPFEVLFDDLSIRRPIRFRGLPTTEHALKNPIIFLGSCRESFDGLPRELSGGPLDFEAYLFWTPKVVPTEHQGSLIRIHGSSGTLFDPTFMRYQVSEQTRLRQITAEIFVHEGLDGALNIDRESFNSAHPHAVYLTKWLHSALRQLATVQKRLAAEARETSRMESREAALSGIQRLAMEVWREETDDPASMPPGIELREPSTVEPTPEVLAPAEIETYFFPRESIVPAAPRPTGQRARARLAVTEEKLKSIAQVLVSFGLLDSVSRPKQERLLKAIYEILTSPDE